MRVASAAGQMRRPVGPTGASARQDVVLAKGTEEIDQFTSDAEDYEARVAYRKAETKLPRQGSGSDQTKRDKGGQKRENGRH